MSSIESSIEPIDSPAPHSPDTILASPRLNSARGVFVKEMLALYEHDPFLSRLLIEVGRSLVFFSILALHAGFDEQRRETWPAMHRLQRLLQLYGVSSPRRIEDIVARFVETGYLESRVAPSDRRVRLLAPSDRMVSHDLDWLAAYYKPLALLFPEPGYPEPLRRDHAYQTAHRRVSMDLAPYAARLMDRNAPIMLFMSRDAGVMVLLKLLALTDATPGAAAQVSFAAMGDPFGISRTHVRNMLQDAERVGLVKLAEGSIAILPPLHAAIDRFLAGTMAGHDMIYRLAQSTGASYNQRGLFVYTGTVTIESLTIATTKAIGGAGGIDAGGGAGLGGGLFVAGAGNVDQNGDPVTGGDVTLSNVSFTGDSATGGAGGAGGNAGGVGGGGMAGAGSAYSSSGGGGGGAGVAGTPNEAGASGSEGGFGGGGGFDEYATGATDDDGNPIYAVGPGGGAGGFGAGAGGNGTYSGGGGGLGAGGDIFVQAGASLTITGGTLGQGAVTGWGGTNTGQAYGAGLFLKGDQSVTFGVGQTASQTTTISGDLTDQAGSDTGNLYNDPGAGSVIIAGAGTVVLGGTDTYTGGTTIAGGTLELQSAAAAGTGAITFAGTSPTLKIDGAAAPTNTLTSLAIGDRILLAGLAYDASATTVLSNGNTTLTVTTAAGSRTLTLAGESGQFAASNLNGATLLTDVATSTITGTVAGQTTTSEAPMPTAVLMAPGPMPPTAAAR